MSGQSRAPGSTPFSGVADQVPLVPLTSGSDDGGRGKAGIKLSFILAGTLTPYTVCKLVRPVYTTPYRSALLILRSAGFSRLIFAVLYRHCNVGNRVDPTRSR